MPDALKDSLVAWLKTRTVADIAYVKKNPLMGIFLKHPELTEYEVQRLVLDPQLVLFVEPAISHEDRVLVIRTYGKNYDLKYILLDPFNEHIERRFKDKVAIVTVYPIRRTRSP